MHCLLSAIDLNHIRAAAISGSLLASAALLLPAQTALAQEVEPDIDPDTIVVAGEHIGDLPDLSIAETLERVVGVSSDRFTADEGLLDFSASYDISDEIQLRFQALNILDEPNLNVRRTTDSLAEASFSGTRYFLGLRGRF